MVKRVAEGTRRYPSVSRVAADPWIRGYTDKNVLGAVIAKCRKLNSLGLQVIRELDTEAHPHYAAFPFEGTALFRNRYHELIEEADIDKQSLLPLGKEVGRLGEPNPYLAVLVADGDNMGKTLSRLDDADQHRASPPRSPSSPERLTTSSMSITAYWCMRMGMMCLAFVPVDKCLSCDRVLHNKFAELLKEWGTPTLSVGVAIGHFMENLEDLRDTVMPLKNMPRSSRIAMALPFTCTNGQRPDQGPRPSGRTTPTLA